MVFALGGCGSSRREDSHWHTYTETAREIVLAVGEEADEWGEEEQTVPLAINASGGQMESGYLMRQATLFARDSLTASEQVWYDQIASCLGNPQGEIRLDLSVMQEGVTENDVDKVFQCVMMDHPELFYVEGFTYTKYTRGDLLVALGFAGTWNIPEEEIPHRSAQIEQAVLPIIQEGMTLHTDYERIKYTYETIIRQTEYDIEVADNQNIYSVFVGKKSVCQGYAKATQFLLNRMGIECSLVQGRVDTGEKHAWNLVKSDGSYYFLDTTWGDTSYLMEGGDASAPDMPEINYDYLCVDSNLLFRTHSLEMSVPIPYCVDTRDNYYVREDALFLSYNREQMSRLFDESGKEKQRSISLRCADESCYREMQEALIKKQEIFQYCSDRGDKIAYSLNDKQLTMTFWVTNE